MREKFNRKDFYISKLGFYNFRSADFDGYLMIEKDNMQNHFLSLRILTQKLTLDKFITELRTLINCIRFYWTASAQKPKSYMASKSLGRVKINMA